jgi:hypothetical protein
LKFIDSKPAAWNVVADTFLWAVLLAYASLAPSSHNSQPSIKGAASGHDHNMANAGTFSDKRMNRPLLSGGRKGERTIVLNGKVKE